MSESPAIGPQTMTDGTQEADAECEECGASITPWKPHVCPWDGPNPPHALRPMLKRMRAGCDTCGSKRTWAMTPNGGWFCQNCGNVFDAPAIDEEVPT